MKIALVYDRVNKFGGAEKVLLALHEIWPEAPLFTAVYSPRRAGWARIFPRVIPSFLNYLPLARVHHELYPWLTPLAFESFDFSGYDVVISVTSAEAKAVITRPATLHLCYCLTPTRYLWSHQKEYLREPGLGFYLRRLQKYLQRNDLVYSRRPDVYIAISQTVQRRIKRYYRQTAAVIYPPVDTDKFKPAGAAEENYFLLVSRLVAYKNTELAVKAFNQLGDKLIIAGTGRETKRLQRLAKNNITFTGWVSDETLVGYFQNCRALVMPQEEDFGIVALEAMAAGRPVISFGKGGATETIIPKQTGILFPEARVDSLISAVKQFKSIRWKREQICRRAEEFNHDSFKQQFKERVELEWQKHKAR